MSVPDVFLVARDQIVMRRHIRRVPYHRECALVRIISSFHNVDIALVFAKNELPIVSNKMHPAFTFATDLAFIMELKDCPIQRLMSTVGRKSVNFARDLANPNWQKERGADGRLARDPDRYLL